MHREIREFDRVDLLRPASGAVAPWVRWVVGLAALTIFGLAALGSFAGWRADGLATRVGEFWFRNGLSLGIAIAIAVVFVPPSRSSRFVRLATLLPIILLAGMLAAWGLWRVVAPEMRYLEHNAPLLLDVPADAALIGMLAATCLAALAVRPRRFEGWIRAVVVIALVQLLLLGLWLPLVSGWWAVRENVRETSVGFLLGPARELVAIALVPPLTLAAMFAALGVHRRGLARRARPIWMVALWVLIPIAVFARMFAATDAQLVYLNLTQFLAAGGFVAALALVALVASLWWRGWAVRRRLARDRGAVTGTIPAGDAEEGPNAVVACLELEGWLSGPRALVDSFEVATAAGRIPIPLGAELAASLPAGSTILEVGESVAVIRRGDRVVVGGLVEPAPDHPFRGASALVPGPAGVVVRRHDDRGGDLASIALVAWRPCVAFLMILTAVALPALAAMLGRG